MPKLMPNVTDAELKTLLTLYHDTVERHVASGATDAADAPNQAYLVFKALQELAEIREADSASRATQARLRSRYGCTNGVPAS